MAAFNTFFSHSQTDRQSQAQRIFYSELGLLNEYIYLPVAKTSFSEKPTEVKHRIVEQEERATGKVIVKNIDDDLLLSSSSTSRGMDTPR